ncbi:MAG: C39 family peptidase [Patescibacteria group bacterium]|jgi:hypothetical protein|nr:C39 family peptidase [Patescibacteria group bacterium]
MKRKHYLNIFIILAFITFGVLLQSFISEEPKQKKAEENKPSQVQTIETKKVIIPPKPVIKSEALLMVPYTVQAPFANWNIHEESCEEAALLMIHYYLSGNQIDIIPPSTANQELIEMVSWEKTNYGREKDLSIYEVGKLAADYYGYKYQVTEDITADNVKQAISEGNPVMVPVITHALRNPHYGPNPSYHILVIKGYNPAGIITNDAGVKEGKDYFYTWDILWQAIDTQSKQMNQGRDMLVVTR